MSNADSQLWQAFQQGDRQAFLTLYDRYFPLLFRYCRQLTPDTQLIEDTLHDFFISLWDRREHLGEMRNLPAYLMVSIRRRLLKQLKQVSSEKLPVQLPSPPFNLVVPSSSSEALQRALQQINESQREALFLKFYNNLSYREVAEVMDLKVDTVYKMVGRALQKLRRGMLTSGLASLGILTELLTLAGLLLYENLKLFGF